MGSAARDLARTVAAAVAHEPVALSVKNLSALSAADAAEIRRVFESELRTAGQPAAEVRIAISENLTQFLLVAEIHRQGDREVLLESWPRTPASSAAAPQDKPTRVTLEKKLVWEQDRPILDVAQWGDAILVLDATRVLLVRVRAVPEGGKANDALLRLIADKAGAPASRAELVSGAKSRLKQVAISGDPAALIAALEKA